MIYEPLESILNAKTRAGCWWFMPVILATWEVEIMRALVQGQPGQIIRKTLSSK
jgi:hypothetical protein